MQAAFGTVCPTPATVADRTSTHGILRIRDMESNATESATFHFALGEGVPRRRRPRLPSFSAPDRLVGNVVAFSQMLIESERTFIVEARTTGAAISLTEPNAWELRQPVVLRARPRPEPRAASTDEPCAAAVCETERQAV